jgi:polyhydroxyalkanoate synthase
MGNPHDFARFARMQQWISDNPDQTAAACSQFVQWFFHENRLALGALRLGGRRVNLRNINQPLFNIYATRDHIVPPSASIALRQLVGTSDYTSYAADTGHIGVCASRPSGHDAPARIIEWLRSRGA